MKHYVIGDTGGHSKALKAGLESIGVDTKNRLIPEGVTIIHHGDLIHKGPSSDALLSFVEEMQDNNPGRWIQLLGNHEAHHLPFSVKFWNCDTCSPAMDTTIQRMFTEGRIKAAHHLIDVEPTNLTLSARDSHVPTSKDWLFTHGGVSRDWLAAVHPQLVTVEDIANDINTLSPTHLSYAGERLGNPGYLASPVWASAPTEVFPTWEGSMPFNQSAGHTYAFDWEREAWFGNHRRIREFKKATKLNPQQRVSITKIGESILIGVDPGFETRVPKIKSQPVTLIGTTK